MLNLKTLAIPLMMILLLIEIDLDFLELILKTDILFFVFCVLNFQFLVIFIYLLSLYWKLFNFCFKLYFFKSPHLHNLSFFLIRRFKKPLHLLYFIFKTPHFLPIEFLYPLYLNFLQFPFIPFFTLNFLLKYLPFGSKFLLQNLLSFCEFLDLPILLFGLFFESLAHALVIVGLWTQRFEHVQQFLIVIEIQLLLRPPKPPCLPDPPCPLILRVIKWRHIFFYTKLFIFFIEGNLFIMFCYTLILGFEGERRIFYFWVFLVEIILFLTYLQWSDRLFLSQLK